MKVVQSLNQNALLVNNDGNECIVVGKGIGFGKKRGDVVENKQEVKFYKMVPEQDGVRELIEDIDDKSLQIAEEIAVHAEEFLDKEFTGNFILSLAGHIQFLEEKYRDYIEIPEPFHYELKYLYPTEYRIAEWAINYLQEEFELALPSAEVSFFTLHFVNGLVENGSLKNVVELSDILNETIEIIEKETNEVMDRETITFSRFIIHLRYFVIRNLASTSKRSDSQNTDFKKIYDLTFEMYPREKQIIDKIKEQLYIDHNIEFENFEDFYLLLHLVRIMNNGVESR
ncbi:PRD domain-containing protein [Tetragenococcus koreensis]|uniref:Transcriptional antiterminator n=2 Tax=Tetragenococcus koreensis TaxID=290335 RepID=A0AAN4UCI9_9ENTE|nr:PRD domain-containing protein [Tetragenococcus koreensis]MDN6729869.1 PRD domain-containing protein [Alkalibacterium sp.]MCF1586256.1 PRD domain-containing protein [Tetragenococcus koreensis]MCF1615840.1 PRD domain-containing protein [Tetragenococcus koreensis]MCF1617306.1 PRD domain-containing protein [Tetragenococcus koreensis]MCF1619138.1 PRD domain-containing protein [Tetragenococcus koreensis]